MGETDLDALLGLLDGYVGTLERYAREVPYETFVASEDEQNKVLFGLHKAIQTAIDVASVMVAERGLGEAATYREIFDRLVTAGLLERDLGDRLAGWAGLRNVIVHIYRIVDLERIYRAYAQESGDLREFAATVRRRYHP